MGINNEWHGDEQEELARQRELNDKLFEEREEEYEIDYC